MYAEEWLGHSLLRCGTSYELGFRKAEEKLSKDLRDNFELGVLAERNRIVKLLEEQMDDGGEHLCETCDVFQMILKGETK